MGMLQYYICCQLENYYLQWAMLGGGVLIYNRGRKVLTFTHTPLVLPNGGPRQERVNL
jgi:hypothetical protein